MIKENEIKQLIQNGFDLELISFELEIPLAELQQIKQEMEKEKNNNKKYSYSEIVNIRNKEAHKKMETMREKYKRLYFKNNKIETILPKKLSQEEIEEIENCIKKIEEIVKEMEKNPKNEKLKNVNNVLREIKKVENYQLTIEQAEQFKKLLDSEQLQMLRSKANNEEKYLYRCKKMIARKLIEAIEIEQYQTDDLEELKNLERKITLEIEKKCPILANAVKSKINNKILAIQQKKIKEKIKNDIPDSILEIINDLVKGKTDIEKAKKIIEEEAKEKVNSKPKNRFTLTEEQEKRQILMKIGITIRDEADQFQISNPETTILQLQELGKGNLEQAVIIVVENLIATGKIDEAKRICNNLFKEEKYNKNSEVIKDIKIRVRNAEISNIILKGLNMQGTEDDERNYWELIEKGIKKGNVKLGGISLGKSQDGLRNITLADIWPEEKQKMI